MKKVIIIGCPGSGKSTLSIKLHNYTKIPLYHLDMMYWNKDKTIVDKSLFLSRLNEVLSKDTWIIDGNYISTLKLRLKECDTVIFLDYDTDICLKGVVERMNKPRVDLPWIEEQLDDNFIEYIKTFNTKIRPDIYNILLNYQDKEIIVFRNREEADNFFNK